MRVRSAARVVSAVSRRNSRVASCIADMAAAANPGGSPRSAGRPPSSLKVASTAPRSAPVLARVSGVIGRTHSTARKPCAFRENRCPNEGSSTTHAAPGVPGSLRGEISVYPGIDFDLKFEIKLIQQLFLGREVGEERARGNARGPGDQCRRRAEPGFGDLVHRCGKNGSAFLRTSHSRHASESTAARSRLAPAVPCDKAGIGNSNGSNAGSAARCLPARPGSPRESGQRPHCEKQLSFLDNRLTMMKRPREDFRWEDVL